MRLSFFTSTFFLSASATTSKEDDGCWKPIPASAIVSVAGSPGFMVGCSAASETGETSSFVLRRGEKLRQHRRHMHRRYSSLLQRDHDSTDSTVEVCFTGEGSNSTMTQMAYAEITLADNFVIRGVDLTVHSELSSQNTFTLNARDAIKEDPEWYVSVSDLNSGAPWTSLSMGATLEFDTDVSGQYVRLVPMASAGSVSGSGFQAQLFGCTADQTALISFKFSSSKQAIIKRFGQLSSFIDDLTSYVCQITSFTHAPSACARVVYADMTDGMSANPAATADGIAPGQIPYVEVFYRILPPSSDCSDCRSASTVQTQLSQALSVSTSSAFQLLQAIDQWIEDEDPYTCYNKQCPSGTLCVNGACVTPADLLAQEQAKNPTVSFTSSSQLDQTLNLSPLQIIKGVDATGGQLTFSSAAVKPGSVLASSGGSSATLASQTSTTSTDSFFSRFLIPIVVVGSIALIILALLGYKLYRRQYLSDEQRASLVQ